MEYRGQEALDRFAQGVSRLLENRKLHGRREFHDLPISIENRKGSIRKGVDPDGTPWETKHKVPYGYIRGTKGVDGDSLDCFIGPNKNARSVFIIHARKAPDFTSFDEDKVMLGFDTPEQAKKMYLRHYDNPRFYGGMTQVPTEVFKDLVEKLSKKSDKLTASKIEEWTKTALKDLHESKRRPTVYYARPLRKYGTKRESEELDSIREAFPGYRISYGSKSRHYEEGIDPYHNMVEDADMVVASPHHKNRLSLGVYSEVSHARHSGIPVKFLRKGKIHTAGKLRTKEGGSPRSSFGFIRKRRKPGN